MTIILLNSSIHPLDLTTHFFQSADTKHCLHLFEKNLTVHLFYFFHLEYLIE